MGLGPSTKETTLHHFRDPLLDVLDRDEEMDIVGVVIAGIPDKNKKKKFIARRTANCLEAMRLDGAVVSIDSWGNSHIDFAQTIEEIGKRGIPVVGMTFVGTQADFVVTNDYMDTIIDFNKSEAGVETEVVGENNPTKIDARKVLASLKLKIKQGRDKE